ncbi:beta family protein [Streptomyces sp. NPDC002671]
MDRCRPCRGADPRFRRRPVAAGDQERPAAGHGSGTRREPPALHRRPRVPQRPGTRHTVARRRATGRALLGRTAGDGRPPLPGAVADRPHPGHGRGPGRRRECRERHRRARCAGHRAALYQTLRRERPSFPRTVVYGDYSVEHAFSADIPSRKDGHGPPWGLLRYTTPDSFLIARAPARGSERADRVRAMARWIKESGEVRGADYGEGERWLHECAAGEGAKRSGTPETLASLLRVHTVDLELVS